MPAKMLASDGEGNVLEIAEYEVLAKSGPFIYHIEDEDLIPLPEGSDIFELKGRRPIGYNRITGTVEEVAQYQGTPLVAVSAFLPPAHTITHTAAFRKDADAPTLPLFAYSPLGWKEGGYVTTAVRVDMDRRQEPALFDRERLEGLAMTMLSDRRENRLIEHLVENCALRYSCPAAMNYVFGRWEMPVPTSPVCNARCVGCISSQPEGGFPSTQERIEFIPTASEIVEAAVEHIKRAQNPIVSFGQGCEGEPLLVAGLIEEALRGIRRQTGDGTLNLNTNGSLPGEVEKLVDAGLSSIRVSMNSARAEYYRRYHRPSGYGFEDVVETIRIAKAGGAFVSINCLLFPGFTDLPSEVEAMEELVRSLRVDMIQWRNLNIDPDLYMEVIDQPDERGMGISRMIRKFEAEIPDLCHGYFNPYLCDGAGKHDP